MKYFLYCRKSTDSEDRQVLSLDTQRTELRRAFGSNPEIEIVEIIAEAKSAKRPGRPLFDRMMARIEAGEAQGIIAWGPDRLARNSIDGGRIIDFLDVSLLLDLKFVTYTFENNPQGKFMLAIMFAQSKHFSDALAVSVKAGLDTKVRLGWRPARPPIGYMTDPRTRTIVQDPSTAPLVRNMFELVREGISAREVVTIARDLWQFRMPTNRRSQGQLISLPSVYRLLANPFYAGRLFGRARCIRESTSL